MGQSVNTEGRRGREGRDENTEEGEEKRRTQGPRPRTRASHPKPHKRGPREVRGQEQAAGRGGNKGGVAKQKMKLR